MNYCMSVSRISLAVFPSLSWVQSWSPASTAVQSHRSVIQTVSLLNMSWHVRCVHIAPYFDMAHPWVPSNTFTKCETDLIFREQTDGQTEILALSFDVWVVFPVHPEQSWLPSSEWRNWSGWPVFYILGRKALSYLWSQSLQGSLWVKQLFKVSQYRTIHFLTKGKNLPHRVGMCEGRNSFYDLSLFVTNQFAQHVCICSKWPKRHSSLCCLHVFQFSDSYTWR